MNSDSGNLSAYDDDMSIQSCSSGTSMYNLDEDSLLEVFAYLNFDELLQASRVCTRFLELSRRCLRKIRHFELDYRAIASKPDGQLRRLEDIFTSMGTNLEAFKFSGGFIMNEDLKRGIIQNVTLNCTSLQHLTINYVELSPENLHTLKPMLSHLTGLDLGRCSLRDGTFASFIGEGSQLKALAVPGNAELEGSFFETWQNCQQLEQLDVSYCYSLDVGRMECFLTRASNLKGVDVTACQWLKKDKEIFNAAGRSIELGAELPVFSYYKNA